MLNIFAFFINNILKLGNFRITDIPTKAKYFAIKTNV